MKYLLVSLSISFFSFLFKGADIPFNKVPENVKTTFRENFSSAEDIEWEKTQNDGYEAEFEIANVDYKAQFNNAGELKRYKHEVNESDLPKEVANIIKNSFSGYKIEDIEKLVINTTSYYQVELEGTILDKNKVFTASGIEATQVDFWD